MKYLALVIPGLFLSSCFYLNPVHSVYRLTLKPEPMDSYHMEPVLHSLTPRKSMDDGKERITKFPAGMVVKYTYLYCVHRNDMIYKIYCENTEARDRYFNGSPGRNFEDWQSWYTTDRVDNFVSICIVADADSNEYVILDENNDEDLSNDSLRTFQTRTYSPPSFPKKKSISFVDAEVAFDYYDGTSVRQGTHCLRIQKWPRGWIAVSSVYGYYGTIHLDGKSYTVGIYKQPDVEFNNSDILWTDVNQNHNDDSGTDWADELILPITFSNRTYKLSFENRFKPELTFRPCDPDSMPPVGIGLKAPDFRESTIGSATTVQLSDYRGQYVVLDFWYCNAPVGLAATNQVYNNIKDRNDIQIISFGDYRLESLPEKLQQLTIQWPHVNGGFDNPTRKLYQVGSFNEAYLIGPDGILLGKLQICKAEDVINMVNKHINQ